jgi:uncharacterized protein YjiS (DUF1127 family)
MRTAAAQSAPDRPGASRAECAHSEHMGHSLAERSAMSYIPMHNRFAEGFPEPEPAGEMLDSLWSRIERVGPPDPDFDELLRRARAARSAALGALLARGGRCLAAIVFGPLRSLVFSLMAARRRARAAAEFYALDDRTLADLGLRRTDIPFGFVRGGSDHRAGFGPRSLR